MIKLIRVKNKADYVLATVRIDSWFGLIIGVEKTYVFDRSSWYNQLTGKEASVSIRIFLNEQYSEPDKIRARKAKYEKVFK